MGRKRKFRVSVEKKRLLETLRGLGYSVSHPLIVHEVEMRGRKSNQNEQPHYMKVICFGGIPACCLSAKGSGPTEQLAEDSAAHAMIEFFRLALPNLEKNNLFANQSEDSSELFQTVSPIFSEFEKAIAADFLSISRMSQHEATSTAISRGRVVKKRVILNLRNPELGYASGNDDGPLVDSDIQIIEDDEIVPHVTAKTEGGVVAVVNDNPEFNNEHDDCIIIEDAPIAVKQMRERDFQQQQTAGFHFARQIQYRKNKYSTNDEIDFGEINQSHNGPSEVLCSVPNVRSKHFVEEYSSESDEGEWAKKRPRIDQSENGNGITDTQVVVHMINKHKQNHNEFVKESDGELGEMIDEWNEKRDRERQDTIRSTNIQSTAARLQQQPSTSKPSEPKLDTNSSLFRKKTLPANFQSKTIGVVINFHLADAAQKYVSSVNTRALDSVINLSKSTWDHYLNNCQPDYVYDRKMRARELLHQEIQKLFPEKCINLQVTGSTVNGCGSYNSDMDMCLCYPTVRYKGQSSDDFYCEQNFSSKILRKIDKAFWRLPPRHSFKAIIKSCQVIPAKVPIIKLLLAKEFEGIEIDINVNNTAGIYNSHLIHYYSLSDLRFPALALMIKHWGLSAGINNSPEGYLNSYTIILLVIHYLQCGVQPAVLPNLQHLFPSKFDKKLPLEQLLLFGEITEKLPPGPQNPSSLGELIIGFFYYYCHFDFENTAISIRSAQVVPRKNLPRDTQNYPMFIEEPFDAINTARSVRTASHMNVINSEFRKALKVISREHFTAAHLGIEVRRR